MFCPQCGSQNDALRFCKSCGVNLEAVRQAATVRDPNENFDWEQASGGMKMFARYFENIARM